MVAAEVGAEHQRANVMASASETAPVTWACPAWTIFALRQSETRATPVMPMAHATGIWNAD